MIRIVHAVALMLVAVASCRDAAPVAKVEPAIRAAAVDARRIDVAPIDVAPIDAPPPDAGAPPAKTLNGKGASTPGRPVEIDELRGIHGERVRTGAEASAAAEARAAKYRDQIFRVEPAPFADAAPPHTRVDAAVGLRTTP